MRIGCRLELFIRPVALYMYPCIGIEICISLCYNHLKGYKACRGSKGERMAHTIREPEKQLNVSAECDVLVCGGGIAGIAAALAAARRGAKTILLEREYLLGGLATLGLVTIYLPLCDGKGHQVSFGITEELLRLSVSRGIWEENRYPKAWLESGTDEERIAQRFEAQYNPLLFASDAEKLLLDTGVKILYGTLAADTVTEDGHIKAVIIENKSGRSAVAVKNVIDTTGDADVCARSGADCVNFGQGNILAAWYYRFSEGEGVRLKMLGYADIPEDEKKAGETRTYLDRRRFGGLDAEEITDFTVMMHQKAVTDVMQYRKDHAGAVPVTFPTIPQFRMTRRIAGISTPDSKPTHQFVPDSIGMIGDWRKRGPVFELPYSCLYGEKIRNLITAGRNISVTDSMWDITRVIQACALTGQAAGTAAAYGYDFADVNVGKLQKQLCSDGVKLHCEEVI